MHSDKHKSAIKICMQKARLMLRFGFRRPSTEYQDISEPITSSNKAQDSALWVSYSRLQSSHRLLTFVWAAR